MYVNVEMKEEWEKIKIIENKIMKKDLRMIWETLLGEKWVIYVWETIIIDIYVLKMV